MVVRQPNKRCLPRFLNGNNFQVYLCRYDNDNKDEAVESKREMEDFAFAMFSMGEEYNQSLNKSFFEDANLLQDKNVKLKSQLEKAEEVILEYNSNYDYYCCELAGSWSEIRKKAREYFSEKEEK